MNCKDAAAQVLQEAGKPLHYREITKLILQRDLWPTSGATPERTIAATLSVDIRERGEDSLFVRVSPGVYGLRCWQQDDTPPRKPMTHSFTDAAEIVLREYGNQQPMHYREITNTALKKGLILTSGKTPEATMDSVIYQEIERMKARGEQPRFVLHGQGLVGLTEWEDQGLEFEVEQHNRRVREELLKHLLEMPPEQFEAVVARLLVALGFEDVEVTSRSNDGGIDVRGVLLTGDAIRTKMAVQVKRWKNNVQAPHVQQVRGSLGAHEQGLIVTTSDFTKGAREEAERPDAMPVGLMNGELMVALLVEHGIGVQKNEVTILTLDDFDSIEE